MFALGVKQNSAGDAFEIEKGNGDVRDYNVRTAAEAVVLYDTSTRRTYSSLEPLVPGAAYLVPGRVHASTQQTIQIRGTGAVSRVKTPCEQGLPHCTYVLQAEQRLPHATEEKAKRSFPIEGGPTAKFTLRGIRSACSSLGQSSFRPSALHRKSCYASVSVMLEKRGGRCRTHGPIRVLSCQMRHTIAAIKAAWCRSLC